MAGAPSSIRAEDAPTGDAPGAPLSVGPMPEPSYVEALRIAGLDVIEGHVWTEYGTFLSDAAQVVVEYTDDQVDGLDVIDSIRGTGVHAFVRRDGSVWLLAQATDVDGAPVVRILVAGSEKRKGKITDAQKDTVGVVTATLAAVAFDAETVDPTEP